MARRGALVAALMFCMALGAFAGSSYSAYYGKYPSSDYQPTYAADKLPKGTKYTTSTYPSCPGKQAKNDLIYGVRICTFQGVVAGVSYMTTQKGKSMTYDMCTVEDPTKDPAEYDLLEKASTYYTKDTEEVAKKGSVDVAAAAAAEPQPEDEPSEWDCKELVMCEGDVITRTQVFRSLVEIEDGEKVWFVHDIMFYLNGDSKGDYVWGYGKGAYFEMSQEEFVLKMAMSNQAARRGNSRMVCGAAGFFKPKCNAFGMLGDLRTCGKCVKPAKQGYAGYIAPDSKYFSEAAPTEYADEEGVYYSCKLDEVDEGDLLRKM